MSLRFLFSQVKPGRAMAVCAVAVALLAGLPAMAAEHGTTQRSETAHAGDPFASYNRELNAAASRALDSAETPAMKIPMVKAAKLSKSPDTRGAKLERNLWSARERVDRLLPVIAPLLRKEGIPVQLAAVVLVESGGNPRALSPKGARGLWQLMPDTAREYGLIVNAATDQRLDVVQSTRAAAAYLRDLYAEFGNWKLALAAYNAGDKTVHRAMARTGGNGFATASIALPAETQSYVPKVMRALGWFGGPVLPGPKKESRLQQVAYAVGD